MGVSYSQLVSEARLGLAAEWLESSTMPIAEISAALGYLDASNFTRAFRRKTGTSPWAFRQDCRHAE